VKTYLNVSRSHKTIS